MPREWGLRHRAGRIHRTIWVIGYGSGARAPLIVRCAEAVATDPPTSETSVAFVNKFLEFHTD